MSCGSSDVLVVHGLAAATAQLLDDGVEIAGVTLLLDGGLAAGVLDADPATPLAAKAAAQVRVDGACPPTQR